MTDHNTKYGLPLRKTMTIPSTVGDTGVKLCGKTYDIPLTEDVLSKHVLFSGAIGSGKTTGLHNLLETVISRLSPKDTMIIFDAKGEFRQRFYRPGIDEILSCDDHATVIWNLFREIEVDGEEKVETNLRELINGFFDEKIRRSNAPFFPTAARDLLYGIATYIKRTIPREAQHNEELYLFLRDATVADIVECLQPHPDLRGLLDYIDAGCGTTEQTQGVYSELRGLSNELLIDCFRMVGDFSIRSFIRNPRGRILFLEYDVATGSVLGPIYKTIFDMAIKETLSRKNLPLGSAWGNVYFVADEFGLLKGLNHISSGLNYSRSLGGKYIIAVQNCRQILDHYGIDNGYSILSAFGTLVSFRNTDRATIEFIQDHYGSTREAIHFRDADYSSGLRTVMMPGKAVEDWDILKLGVGEAIVSVSDYGPEPVLFQLKGPERY